MYPTHLDRGLRLHLAPPALVLRPAWRRNIDCHRHQTTREFGAPTKVGAKCTKVRYFPTSGNTLFYPALAGFRYRHCARHQALARLFYPYPRTIGR